MVASVSTLSHFLRHSGAGLAALEAGDVLLTRRDGPDVVLTTDTRARTIADGLAALSRVLLDALDHPDAGPGIVRLASHAIPGASLLSQRELGPILQEIAQGAAAAAEVGTIEPLARALESYRRIARVRASAGASSAHASRPVAIPDDVDHPSIVKASGVVELPLHVRWSHPRRVYDLDDDRQRRMVYEQVLSEGLDDDVRRFIDVETLVRDWNHLVLPSRVRSAWAGWLHRRGVSLPC